MSKSASIVDRLRAAIRTAEAAGNTQYAIAKRAGIGRSQLTRLMHGERVPRLDTAESIAAALGLRLALEGIKGAKGTKSAKGTKGAKRGEGKR